MSSHVMSFIKVLPIVVFMQVLATVTYTFRVLFLYAFPRYNVIK